MTEELNMWRTGPRMAKTHCWTRETERNGFTAFDSACGLLVYFFQLEAAAPAKPDCMTCTKIMAAAQPEQEKE